MDDTLKRIIASLPDVKVAQQKFMYALFSVLMSCMGKATFRNMSRYSEPHEKTFSRWYRRSFPYLEMNRELLIKEGISKGELIAALDASFLSKSGKCTEGLGSFWNGSVGKSEKGLEISSVAVVDVKANTAYHLDSIQTQPLPKKGARVTQYCEQIALIAPELKALGVEYLLTDGYYTKKRIINSIEKARLKQIGKLRQDADLWWAWDGGYSGMGRPRKYKEKAAQKGNLSKWNHVYTEEDGTDVYQAKLLHKASGGILLNIVLLRKVDGSRVSQALLFSTDLKQDAAQIVSYYKARFQIEFLFRDAKQHTGLRDCQSTKKEAIHNHVNASLTALNIMKLEDRRDVATDEETVISIDSWKRRKINQNLMNRLFCLLDLDLTQEKVRATYKELSNYGRIAA